jgi:hypothetical protein
MRGWAAVAVIAGFFAGCAPERATPPFSGEPWLAVWAGDADRQSSDFLAVIDADWSSPSYGKVLRTVPVRSRGNEPQALNAEQRNDRRIFATGVLTGRTFVFDGRQPLATKLLHVDEAGPGRTLWAPGEPASLPNGHVAVACADPAHFRGEPRELLAAPGGVLELDENGGFVRELPAADASARAFIVAPRGATASATIGRLVLTSTAHGYAPTATGERAPGISVQVRRLDDLRVEKTVVLSAGPRGEENLAPLAPRALHRDPVAFVDTEQGGALYASDSLQTSTPVFRLVFDFGAGSLPGGAAITPDDRFYVVALGGKNRVASLDVRDPWSPKLVSSVRVGTEGERAGGPHWLAMSADGTRVAVSDYTVDTPSGVRDGDHRVYMLRLDPATGALRLDDAFRDELTGRVGVDFNRAQWAHGDAGPARPAGLLFVSAEPPPAKKR